MPAYILPVDFPHGTFIGSLIILIGAILAFIGFEGLVGNDGFTIVGCGGPEPRFCLRGYSLDLLAILIGAIAVYAGTRILVQDR